MKQEILVVDDEPDLVKLVTEVLREADFSVSSANNAEETMRKIRESKPDLICSILNCRWRMVSISVVLWRAMIKPALFRWLF